MSESKAFEWVLLTSVRDHLYIYRYVQLGDIFLLRHIGRCCWNISHVCVQYKPSELLVTTSAGIGRRKNSSLNNTGIFPFYFLSLHYYFLSFLSFFRIFGSFRIHQSAQVEQFRYETATPTLTPNHSTQSPPSHPTLTPHGPSQTLRTKSSSRFGFLSL